MKKKIAILLAAVCAVSMLGGCGTGKKGGDDKKESKKTLDYEASDYVTLGEYKGIKVSLASYDVTEEDVKSNVESMIEQKPSYEDTDKQVVEDGDFVNIDYEGLKDGTAFDGGTAQGSVLEIGSNSFIDGFESGLIGAKVGDKVSLNLTFPENYQSTDLAGQDVVFNVTVNKIVQKKDINYDNMTDEYVAANYADQGYDTVEALKTGVKEQLTKSKENSKESDIQNAVLTNAKEICKVKELPDGLLDQRVKEYKEQMEKSVKENYKMEMDKYLESINTTEEDFNTQITDYMQDNLETELVLSAIAQKEEIEADEDGYKEYVTGVISSYGYEDEDALIKEYGEDYVRSVYVNNKVIKMLVDNAVVTYDKEPENQESQENQKSPQE